jgi:Txe/YoeB family toxin of toxin-antitoxin system
MYAIVYTKKAKDDIPKLKTSGIDKKAKALIELIKENPYKSPPSFEKLKGELKGAFSRRLNAQHRLVYEVDENEKTIKILRMWTHYED